MALSKDGRILGVRDWFLCDTGAYDPYGLTIPINTQCTLLGPYDIPNYETEFTSVFTNKPIVTPVRGAGRQHGVFVSERLLDLAARELGIDRVEIRKRNLLGPDRFPHNHEIMFQDSAPLVYDSGNYLPALEQAAEIIGYDAFLRDEQPRLRAEGTEGRRRHRLLRRGHGHRSVRGRARHRRTERDRARRDRRRHAGPGALHRARADRGGCARRRRRRRARRHRRHARVSLGHGHVRQPRRGRRRQRVSRGGDVGARKDSRPGQRGARCRCRRNSSLAAAA